MTELREFVAEQVKRFQDQLHELFFCESGREPGRRGSTLELL